MKLTYPTTKEQFVNHYLQALNGFLDLSPTEIDVLAEFVKVYISLRDTKLPEDLIWQQVFSTHTRKQVQSNLNYPTRGNVDQYKKRLVDKKLIFEENGVYKIKPIAIPQSYGITIEFRPSQDSSGN